MIVRGADFVQEPVKGLVLERRAVPPTDVKEAYAYYDTVQKKICVWDGTTWQCGTKGDTGDQGPQGEKGDPGAVSLLKMSPTILLTVPAIDAHLDGYSASFANHTWYRFAISFIVSHPQLGGGIYYVEGYKAEELYEWQVAISYDTPGIRRMVRSKFAGSWGTWVVG